MARDDLIWENPVLGTRTFYNYDAADGEIILETVQSVETIIEANKRALNNVSSSSRFADGRLIAAIPMTALMRIIVDAGITPRQAILDGNWLSRVLNNSDYRHFRTWPGRV